MSGNSPVSKGGLFVPERPSWALPEPRLCVRPLTEQSFAFLHPECFSDLKNLVHVMSTSLALTWLKETRQISKSMGKGK